MGAQFILLTQDQLMLNGILEIPLDIHVGFLARNHSANSTDLQQHALKIKKTVTAKDCFSVTGKYLMKISLRKFMTQLRQTTFTSLFSGWVDQFKGHKDLVHHELFHAPNTIYDSFLADREWRRTARWILK